nr:ectin-like [Drosophila takahashii]
MFWCTIVPLFLAVLELSSTRLPDVTVNSVLEDHNYFRTIKDFPELSLSKKLSKECEAYAKHLATLDISNQTLFEENLSADFFFDQTGYPLSDPKKIRYTENICEFEELSCVSYWGLNGGTCYDRTLKGNKDENVKSLADKYTALMWRSSKKMGVGIAPKYPTNKNGRKIMVVRYSPPGNVPGKYKENLPTEPTPEAETTTPSSACGKDLNIIILNCFLFILNFV